MSTTQEVRRENSGASDSMGVVQFSGLASGLDTNAIIDAMLGVERIPMQRIEAQNSDLKSQQGILDNLSSALSKLRTKAKSLATSEDFLSFKGSSSNTAVANLTASGDAVRGKYDLIVTELAQSQRNYSKLITDKDASLTATDTTFTMDMNGTLTTIDVTAGMSLSTLVQKINDSGADVTAGLLYTGAGGYHLQISGNKTGDIGAITFGEGTLDLQLDAGKVQDAQDAEFSIDGIDIKSSTNVVSDALPGATLELLAKTTDATATKLSIDPNKDAVKSKLKDFTDAFNGVMSIINSQVGEGKGTNTLNGDGTVRSIEQQLGQLISNPLDGLYSEEGFQLALSDLGFETQRDGTLVLDDETLSKALDTSFEKTAKYFTGEAGSKNGISNALDSLIKGLVEGKTSLLGARKDGISGRIRSNEDKIADEQKYLDAYEAQLRAQYTALEQTMSQLQNQGRYLAQVLQ
jgi:flagellar hook-associated protein 2